MLFRRTCCSSSRSCLFEEEKLDGAARARERDDSCEWRVEADIRGKETAVAVADDEDAARIYPLELSQCIYRGCRVCNGVIKRRSERSSGRVSVSARVELKNCEAFIDKLQAE